MSTNMNLLRGKLKERSMTQQELAHKIGMDSSTLSRKLASDGLKFTVGEMHDIAATLNLTANECKSIFFCCETRIFASSSKGGEEDDAKRTHSSASVCESGSRHCDSIPALEKSLVKVFVMIPLLLKTFSL